MFATKLNLTEQVLTEADAYAFRRMISKMKVEDTASLSPLVHMIIDVLDPVNNPVGWQFVQDMITRDQNILQQVMMIDPKAPPPKPRLEIVKDHDPLQVPELPKLAHMGDSLSKAAEGVGRFHNEMLTWLRKKSPMTPDLFLYSAPLWATGLAIARRCAIHLNFASIHPHIYALWVAPTTHYHKTTGLDALTMFVRETIPHMLLPESTPPEMLIAKLSGQLPANYEKLSPHEQRLENDGVRFAGQRGLIIDEASKILSPKKYMEGFVEAIMQLFDAPKRMERELRSDGKMVVYNPAMSLIGATTPALLSRKVSDADWESGLMARMMCLTPIEKEVECVVTGFDLENGEVPEDLKKRYLNIYNAFEKPKDVRVLGEDDNPMDFPTVSAQIDKAALEHFNNYYRAMHELTSPKNNLDERLRGNYGRFPTMAMKVALNFTVMDWVEEGAKGAPHITEAHWAKAQQFTEVCRQSVHRLLADLNISQDVKNEQRILDYIARSPKERPPSKRDIHRGTGIKHRKDVYAAIDALMEEGVIAPIQRSGARGPSTTAYIMIDPNKPAS